MTSSLPAVRTPGNLPADVRPILDPEGLALDVWSSIPETERGTIIRLIQGKSTPLAEHIGKPLTVRHVLAHRVESVDQETGEVQTLDRIVLVTPTGQAFQCVSAGIRRSLQLLMHYYGAPPWEPGLAVVVEQVPTKRGFRTFILSPANQAEDVTPTASRK